ncbi:three component ABC system middle component [Brachyspira pilosicoli]|uniref:three component ABC system middle component n=1 Tax=Brachyspira pilosicoli TaxID=52584 RepID=UPI0012F4BA07|nr:three component ABC system middle component [Brachyspira pilosicoli]
MIINYNLEKMSERSLEEKYFYNPIKILNIIIYMLQIYKKYYEQDVPFLIPFIITPLIIYEDYFNLLPKSNRTDFIVWISRDASKIRYDFTNRYKISYPYIQKSILLGIANDIINIENCNFKLNKDNIKIKSKKLETKIKILVNWFSPSLYIDYIKFLGDFYEFSNTKYNDI